MKNTKLTKLIKEEMLSLLNEVHTFNVNGKKLNIRFDVNDNPTKKGIKIQFLAAKGTPPLTPQDKQSLGGELQVMINKKLAPYGLTVDFDTDVPYQDVIGYTLKLSTIQDMILKALKGETPSNG